MQARLTLTCALLGVSLLGAQDVKVPSKKKVPPMQQAAQASNAFGSSLYQALAKRKGNLFLSPYSISVALAMTRVGALDQTAEEMDQVLRTQGFDASKAHQALRAGLEPRQVRDGHRREDSKIPTYELAVANRVWVQRGLRLEAPFVRAQKSLFGAPLARVDFARSAAVRKEINDWVAAQTRKRIQDIVPESQPTPDTLLALANAIYFKAPWAEAFREAATKDALFTTQAGKKKEVRMMRRTDRMFHAETPDAHIVELPYLGSDCSFCLVLPKKEQGLAALEQKLTGDNWDSWMQKLQGRRVALQLPKFKFTSSFELSGMLSSMGMKAPFSPKLANFEGITKEKPLFIGLVLHKAFIALDEKGTEAAAATVVMMKLGSAPPSDEPLSIVADHPFLFAIRHRKSGCILFLGRVADPTR